MKPASSPPSCTRPGNVNVAVRGPVASHVPTEAPSEPILTKVPSAMKASNEGGFVGSLTSGSTIQVPTSGCSEVVGVACCAAVPSNGKTPIAPSRTVATSAAKPGLRGTSVRPVSVMMFTSCSPLRTRYAAERVAMQIRYGAAPEANCPSGGVSSVAACSPGARHVGQMVYRCS